MLHPFVTGSAAILMQWGIVEGHDPYLYGEKVKAWSAVGQDHCLHLRNIPNEQVGYGALCVRESLKERKVVEFDHFSSLLHPGR